MANTYLTRTTGTPTSRKKATFSLWVKKTKLSNSDNQDMICITTDTTKRVHVRFTADNFEFINYDGTTNARLITDRKFRDISAWYHIVVVLDSTQVITSNRMKLYINGVQETSFSTEIYPALNFDFDLNFANTQIGKSDTTAAYFYGVMSHVHYTDGYAYDASYFGSTDSVTGEWKINTSPSVTYGTNGFFILKDGNSVTDQSGEGNDFTVGGGTLTKTEDNPSNVFCVMNALDSNQYQTLSSGNLKIVNSSPASSFGLTKGSIGVTKGKWYWEVKYTYGNAGHFGFFKVSNTAITNEEDINGNLYTVAGTPGNFTGVGFRISGGGDILEIEGNVDTGVDFSSGDTLGLAFDGDSGKLYAFKNGTELTGQNIGAGTSLMSAVTMDDIFLPFISNGDGGSGTKTGTSEVNFGNGYFGTTAVSSAGTNVSGIGIFEYDVPTGYTALSTKGLNL